MQRKTYTFSGKETAYYFNGSFSYLERLTDPSRTVLVTDRNIFGRHKKKFNGWNVIVLDPGEEHKVQATVDEVIRQLIAYKADRRTMVVGIGGGVVTDISGYAASVYMRGVRFGFVPTSLLAMVDASIGGKNGIDVGVYKNLVGTIRQPEFLLYDSALLKTLPAAEWVNGFAEIIKHACIRDGAMFRELERCSPGVYKRESTALDKIIRRNVMLKSAVVVADEFEQGDRKLLNFGHTWGHAIETRLSLPHGHAVSIGMVMACRLSEQLTGFKHTDRIVRLLRKYGLPVSADVNKKEVFGMLAMDKKRSLSSISYVLLKDIGKAVVQNISLEQLEGLIMHIDR